MAIDTLAKRLRAIDFGLPIFPGMPIPDDTIDGDDRAALLWLYHAGGAAVVIIETLVCAAISIGPALTGSASMTPALAGRPSIRKCD